uniref:Arrestin C-terminal-like domain-containing protein n=1 Tax=Oryzias melastigma TaxID=30732 RepID=A0A3B3BKV6_ORYME
MPSVKSLTIEYDSLNEEGTFSEGDIMTGIVTLTLRKDTKVKSLFVKLKGDADVFWSETSEERNDEYSAHTRYFKLKQSVTPKDSDGESMPSSFRELDGNIVYKIEAKLCRSWRMDVTASKELPFISKFLPNIQSPMVFKTSHPASTMMELVLSVKNSSSKKVTPKLSFKKTVTFYAKGTSKSSTEEISRMVFDSIEQNDEKELKCVMKIPANQAPSIQNCDIIKLEYTLKVYLDISLSFDPKIVFPITILHSDVVSRFQRDVTGPSDFGGPSNSDFPKPAVSMGPYPVPPQVGGYGYPAGQGFSAPPPEYPGDSQPHAAPPGMYPPLPPVSEGYGRAVPQQPVPYGSAVSTPYLSPTGTPIDQPPSAPPMEPQFSPPSLAPPAYSSLFSSPVMNEDFLSQGDKTPSK